MTEKDIARKLEFVRFNMACEGFDLTQQDIETGREILQGKITGDESVERILQENGYKITSGLVSSATCVCKTKI